MRTQPCWRSVVGGLQGAAIELCSSPGGLGSEGAECSNATLVLDAWDGAVKFKLPSAGTTSPSAAKPHTFRACVHDACSGWRSLNAPAL